jgi:hypothetical protein
VDELRANGLSTGEVLLTDREFDPRTVEISVGEAVEDPLSG